jgi:hypothetical protein
VLRDVNTLPSLHGRPHSDRSVQKRLGSIDELLKRARQNLPISVSTGPHRLTKETTRTRPRPVSRAAEESGQKRGDQHVEARHHRHSSPEHTSFQ